MKKLTLGGKISFIFSVCVYHFLSWASVVQAADDAQQMGTMRKLVDVIIEGGVKYGFQVLGGIAILIMGWIISRFVGPAVQKFLSRHHVDITVSKFIVGTVQLTIIALAGLIALGKFGIEIAPFIAGLSVVGFATSFALQGPLSNYASGATLIFTKPFKVGDIIEVIGVMGEVQDMTLPRTLLKTVDNTIIVIPNKHIIGEVIHNFSGLKRLDIKVGVSYQSDMAKAINILQKIILGDQRISQRNLVKVGISEFADSSVNLYARLWCRQGDYWDTMFSINKNIFDEFKRQGIVIPFPQQDVHIYEEKS